MKTNRYIQLFVLLMGFSSIAWAEIKTISELPTIEHNSMRVFIVRHAETYHQIQKLDEDSDLYYKITPNGEKQSKAVGIALKSQPIVACFSSETDRTERTLELTGLPLEKGLKAVREKAFNRPAPGQKEDGTPSSFPWRIEQWKLDRDPQPKGGESLAQAVERCYKFMRRLESAYGKAIVVVSHGDIIAGLVGAAEKVPVWDRWEKFNADSASICAVDIYKEGPVVLRAFNIKVWDNRDQ